MSDIAIRVQNLGKQYHIGALQKNGGAYSYKSLRDSISNAAGLPFRAARALFSGNGQRSDPQDDTIWALKDVSFEVKQGEVVGVIGRNGAGKSTLLKLLSRITEPTTGRAEIHGRVASLLEVGTGFHPELTGRDNVYLNGAILGMKRAEIIRKFDEIVAFAEVEKFIDTPVKHYSSGMYLRLAFAVAAHLEPEILIVDEVLAVGDLEFQKKCLGKMQDVSSSGRTVVFVSHNLAAIQRLCERCVLLSHGRVAAADKSAALIDHYMKEVNSGAESSLETATNRSGNGIVRLVEFRTEDPRGRRIDFVRSGSPFYLVFKFRCSASSGAQNVNVGFSLHLADETMLSIVYSSYSGQTFKTVPHGGEFRCYVGGLPLKEGRYFIGARVEVNGVESDWPKGMIGRIDVVPGESYPILVPGQDGGAPILVSGDWSVSPQ